MTAIEPNVRPRHQVPIWTLTDWEALRNRLIERRKRLGLTQVQLSERMGRSRDYVAKLESNDQTMPTLAITMQWVKALRGTIVAKFPGDD